MGRQRRESTERGNLPPPPRRPPMLQDETSREQLMAAMSDESDMLDYCMTCVGFLVTGARAGIVSAYREHLAPLVITLLRPGEIEDALFKVGVCMADDVIEWCVDAAPAGVGAGAAAAAAAAGTALDRLAATGLLSFPGAASQEQGLQRLCEVFCKGGFGSAIVMRRGGNLTLTQPPFLFLPLAQALRVGAPYSDSAASTASGSSPSTSAGPLPLRLGAPAPRRRSALRSRKTSQARRRTRPRQRCARPRTTPSALC